MGVEPWVVGVSVIMFGIVVFLVLSLITMTTPSGKEVENGTEHSEEHQEDSERQS